MKHKLFHTLVLSSAALLEGCASTPPAPVATPQGTQHAHTDPAPTPAATPVADAPAETSTSLGPLASGQNIRVDANTAPSIVASVRAMVADARACSEVGWATTKSASATSKQHVELEGRAYWCLPEGLQRSPRCCLAANGEPAPR